MDPDDGYLGSGKILKRSIAKYGLDNFTKKVLAVFDTAQPAFSLEKELVDQHKPDPLCMNLRCGGAGGFDYINETGRNGWALSLVFRDKMAGITAVRKRRAEDPEFDKRLKAITEKARRINVETKAYMIGLAAATAAARLVPFTAERRRKASEVVKSNPVLAAGSAWVTDGIKAKKIAGIFIEAFLSDGWFRGKRLPIAKKERRTARHGTMWMYKKKCRCLGCRAANRDRIRKNRSNKNSDLPKNTARLE